MADPASPEERNVLAAELALDVLVGDERAAALRLRLSDKAFAAQVERWELHFAALCAELPAADVPDRLWRAIEERLDSNGEGTSVVRAMRRWRAAALAAGSVAAALALVLVSRPEPAPRSVPAPTRPVAIAQLSSEQSGLVFAARYETQAPVLRIRTEHFAPSTKAPELWVIPADGVPRSLGLVAPEGASTVQVSPELRPLLARGATLAITLEDAATAPHAAPGSPPIAAGKISVL